MISRGEVSSDRGDKMLRVDLDVDKDVQGFYRGLVDRDKTRMAIVDKEIAVKSPRREIVYTTGTVGNIAHNQRFNIAKPKHQRDGI